MKQLLPKMLKVVCYNTKLHKKSIIGKPLKLRSLRHQKSKKKNSDFRNILTVLVLNLDIMYQFLSKINFFTISIHCR